MRHATLLTLATVIITLAAAAPAGAAPPEDGPRLALLHDGGANTTTHAGALNTFTWLLLDAEGTPDFHNNALFEVELNGATLLRTTAASGHDYDGIDAYQVVFPEAGEYVARVTIGDDGPTATVRGAVLPAPAQAAATVALEAPATATSGELTEFAFALHDGNGKVAPGTDFTVSIRRADDGFEAFRARTHAADGAHGLQVAFPEAGEYVVRLTGHGPTTATRDAPIPPVSIRHAVEVEQGPALPSGTPTAQPLTNAVTTGAASDGFTIYGTYDPYTSVGPHGRMRLGVVVLDADTGEAAPDVDFTATLRGPTDEVLFETTDLRERDGVLEVITAQPRVGDYALHVMATRDGATVGELTHAFSIHPPAAPTGAGPQFATLEGAEGLRAGAASDLTVFVGDAAGAPLMHSEVDFEVLDAAGAPLLTGKLHTHSDGRFPFSAALPAPGEYALDLAPANLHPAPTFRYYGPEAGTPPHFPLRVADGPGLAAPVDDALGGAGAGDVTDAVPGAGALAALVAVALAAAIATRRP